MGNRESPTVGKGKKGRERVGEGGIVGVGREKHIIEIRKESIRETVCVCV